MKILAIAPLLLSAASLVSSAALARRDDPPHVDGLLSIVLFSSGGECNGGVAISTGTWSNTDNHCSTITGQDGVISAKATFLDAGCEVRVYSGQDCTGTSMTLGLDICTGYDGELQSFSLAGCTALS